MCLKVEADDWWLYLHDVSARAKRATEVLYVYRHIKIMELQQVHAVESAHCVDTVPDVCLIIISASYSRATATSNFYQDFVGHVDHIGRRFWTCIDRPTIEPQLHWITGEFT